MQEDHPTNTNGGKHGREKIRHLFGSALDNAGVDCFTVYVQDLWNDDPDIAIPQEIDERLWYREPMRATTPPGYLYQLRKTMSSGPNAEDPESAIFAGTPLTLDIPFHAWFVSDAFRLASDRPDYAARYYPSCTRLLQSFVRRESIASVAIFMTTASVVHHFFLNRNSGCDIQTEWIRAPLMDPDRPEFLFLNFRRTHQFDITARNELASIASRVFGHLPLMIVERGKSWPPMMIRAIRTQSTIAEFASRSMRRPLLPSAVEMAQEEKVPDAEIASAEGISIRKPAAPRVHELQGLGIKLVELIRPVLDQIANTRGQGLSRVSYGTSSFPREMVISVYLLDPCGEGESPLHGETDGRAGLYLSNVAQLSTWDSVDRTDPTLPAGAELRTQRCFDGKPSITTCTVLTGRSYYLEVVDDDGTCAFEFTLDQGPATRTFTDEALQRFASAIKEAAFPRQGPKNLPCFDLHVARSSKRSDSPLEGVVTAVFDPNLSPPERIDALHWAALESLSNVYGASWVVAKLRKLVECDYSQIYRNVTKPPSHERQSTTAMSAGRAMAELCVPIVVDRQTIGCVNLEYFGLKLPDYTATNMLFNLATTIGSVVVDTQTKRMLAAIEHAVNRILTGQIKKPSDYGLDQLTQTAQRSLRVQDVTILARDPFQPNEPFTELGGSWGSFTGTRAVLTPRENGWTHYIARQKSEAFCGVLLQTDGHTKDITAAYRLFINPNVENPSPMVRSIPLDKFDTFQTVNPPKSEKWMHECCFFMGLALRDPKPAGTGVSPIVGVMWCVSAHPPTEIPPRRETGSKTKREVPFALRKYVFHAAELAKRCALVPTIYRSNLFSPARFMKLSTHGDIPTITTHFKENLISISQFLKSADRALLERSDYEGNWADRTQNIRSMATGATLRAAYLTDWFSLVGRLCSARPQEALQEHIKSNNADSEVDLSTIIQEAKEISLGYPANRRGEFKDEFDGSIRIRTCPSILREILVQVLSNALTHGKSSDGIGRITIRTSRVGTFLRLTIRDQGRGFRDFSATVSAPHAPHRNGVRIIESLAAALCGSSRYSRQSFEPPASGVEWTFTLPV